MLVDFFTTLRRFGVPCSMREYLTLLEALDANLAFADLEAFHRLARTCLVKDERHYDAFDRAFATYFEGLSEVEIDLSRLIPAEWLAADSQREFDDASRRRLESLDKLLETLKQRLAEQNEAHHGGSQWVGTGGTSPFGHAGYHPEGVRIGGEAMHSKAAKVWERREFADYADDREIGTRNIKMAMRRLRRFARTGAREELDLAGTVRATADRGGLLDLRMVPERHNVAKVLLLLDVGGSMDPFVRTCETLFSAARSEFKHLEHYYFHNFVYERLWRDNRRRFDHTVPTWELLRTYPRDYRVIFVGDARMGPYEIAAVGGSVEHMNTEPGAVWMDRVTSTFERVVWLNPVDEKVWDRVPSIQMTRELLDDRMYPLTLDGLDRAMRCLGR